MKTLPLKSLIESVETSIGLELLRRIRPAAEIRIFQPRQFIYFGLVT